MPTTAITDSFSEGIVSLVLATNQVFLSDDELPLKGNDHTLAVHVVVKCEGMIITRVLIDNGSALNVCLMATLKRLKVDLLLICPSTIIIRAFDGTCQEMQGKN